MTWQPTKLTTKSSTGGQMTSHDAVPGTDPAADPFGGRLEDAVERARIELDAEDRRSGAVPPAPAQVPPAAVVDEDAAERARNLR